MDLDTVTQCLVFPGVVGDRPVHRDGVPPPDI